MGTTDAEAEALHQYFDHLMWWADMGKYPVSVKDWGQKEKGEAEDEMII